MKRLIAAAALSLIVLGSGATIADAVPGPGNSNQCAPRPARQRRPRIPARRLRQVTPTTQGPGHVTPK